MQPSRGMWTGIALLAAALTVAEGAAVTSAARGAQRWWSGDQGWAVRRAGTIVGGMIADRLGSRPGLEGDSFAGRVAELRLALEPLAATGGCRGDCAAVRIHRRDLERIRAAVAARVAARQAARVKLERVERLAL